jgi:hypothetical protein
MIPLRKYCMNPCQRRNRIIWGGDSSTPTPTPPSHPLALDETPNPCQRRNRESGFHAFAKPVNTTHWWQSERSICSEATWSKLKQQEKTNQDSDLLLQSSQFPWSIISLEYISEDPLWDRRRTRLIKDSRHHQKCIKSFIFSRQFRWVLNSRGYPSNWIGQYFNSVERKSLCSYLTYW